MMGKMRSGAIASAVAALLLGSGAVGVPDAQAAPTVCEPGTTWISTPKNLTKTRYVVTHVSGYHAAPGASFTRTKSASFERQLSSSVSGTVNASVSGGKVIATAQAELGATLAKNGSRTSTRSVAVTETVQASSKDRYYAFYNGYASVSGVWQQKRCNQQGTAVLLVRSGTWKSYRPAPLDGVALCPAKRYRAGSLAYSACRQTWG